MGPSQGDAPAGQDPGESFEQFVRGRSAQLFRLALLLAGQNQADAEDMLQVALERAWRRWTLLPWDRDPEPYVRRALVNLSIDRGRRLRRRGEQPLGDADLGPVAGDHATEIARRDLLLRYLAVLSPRQRAVLVLRFWADMPEAEVAGLMRCSVGTIKSQASRGIAKLRSLAKGDANASTDHAEVREGHG